MTSLTDSIFQIRNFVGYEYDISDLEIAELLKKWNNDTNKVAFEIFNRPVKEQVKPTSSPTTHGYGESYRIGTPQGYPQQQGNPSYDYRGYPPSQFEYRGNGPPQNAYPMQGQGQVYPPQGNEQWYPTQFNESKYGYPNQFDQRGYGHPMNGQSQGNGQVQGNGFNAPQDQFRQPQGSPQRGSNQFIQMPQLGSSSHQGTQLQGNFQQSQGNQQTPQGDNQMNGSLLGTNPNQTSSPGGSIPQPFPNIVAPGTVPGPLKSQPQEKQRLLEGIEEILTAQNLMIRALERKVNNSKQQHHSYQENILEANFNSNDKYVSELAETLLKLIDQVADNNLNPSQKSNLFNQISNLAAEKVGHNFVDDSDE